MQGNRQLLIPGPATHEHATAIGILMLSWTLIESAVNKLLRLMLKADEMHAFLILTEMQYRQKMDLLKVLLQELQLPSALNQEYEKLLGHVEDAHQVRNAVIHASAWVKGNSSNSIRPLRIKARGKIIISGLGHHQLDARYDFTPERILEECALMQTTFAALMEFVELHKEALRLASLPTSEMIEAISSLISQSEGTDPPK